MSMRWGNRFSVILFLLALLAPLSVQADKGGISDVEDLRTLAKQSQQHQAPILLMVSQEYCHFCDQLRAEILRPMQISGDYTERAVIAQISMDAGLEVRDWNGQIISTTRFIDRYKVWLTPTLLLLNESGEMLHEPMLGVNTVEMYGYYIDQALDIAKQHLQDGKTVPVK